MDRSETGRVEVFGLKSGGVLQSFFLGPRLTDGETEAWRKDMLSLKTGRMSPHPRYGSAGPPHRPTVCRASQVTSPER